MPGIQGLNLSKSWQARLVGYLLSLPEQKSTFFQRWLIKILSPRPQRSREYSLSSQGTKKVTKRTAKDFNGCLKEAWEKSQTGSADLEGYQKAFKLKGGLMAAYFTEIATGQEKLAVKLLDTAGEEQRIYLAPMIEELVSEKSAALLMRLIDHHSTVESGEISGVVFSAEQQKKSTEKLKQYIDLLTGHDSQLTADFYSYLQAAAVENSDEQSFLRLAIYFSETDPALAFTFLQMPLSTSDVSEESIELFKSVRDRSSKADRKMMNLFADRMKLRIKKE